MKRYVYFFQAANGLIKIGQSGDPAARLKALQHVAKQRLVVIGVMLSAHALKEEAAIHRECVEWHFEGEWFRAGALQKVDNYRSRFLAEMPLGAQLNVQTWISADAYDALIAAAKTSTRSISSFVRRTLYKELGLVVDEDA